MSQLIASDRRVWRSNYLSFTLVAQLLCWLWILVDGMYSESTFQFSRISWIVRDHTWYSTEALYDEIPLWGKHYLVTSKYFLALWQTQALMQLEER